MEGYIIFILGKNFKPLASATKVNEPVIKACEAITAAIVAKTIAAKRMFCGIISKNGLKSPFPAL